MICPGVDDGPCPGKVCVVVRGGYIGLGMGSCNEGTRPTPCCTCASGDSTGFGDDEKFCLSG